MSYTHSVKVMDVHNGFYLSMIAHCGYGIDWSRIDSQQQWIQANIEGFYGNLNPLIQIFEICFIQNT